MFDLLFSFDAWVALLTLTVLEIVLGIDNIIFLALVANRVVPEQRPLARRIGLFLALGLRVAFLFSVALIIHLSLPGCTLSRVWVSSPAGRASRRPGVSPFRGVISLALRLPQAGLRCSSRWWRDVGQDGGRKKPRAVLSSPPSRTPFLPVRCLPRHSTPLSDRPAP